MKLNFDNEIENLLKLIIKNAQEQNLRVFFVGGVVRDYFLNLENKDLDLILEGNAIDFSSKLPPEIKIKSIHKDFATVKLQYKNSQIDLASTRVEKYPYYSCLPNVVSVGVDIKKDVIRRDFTVNSLYLELSIKNNEICYKLIDLVDGVNDINKKILKSLHNKTYYDDFTRILRGINFKNRFGFDFSLKDKKLIKNFISNFKEDYFKNASTDRIMAVFFDILKTKNYILNLKDIAKYKLYKVFGVDELKINYKKIEKMVDELNLDDDVKSQFILKILRNENLENDNSDDDFDLFELFKKFEKLNLDEISYYFYFNYGKLKNYKKYQNTFLFTKGYDLINLGFEGKKIGEILNNLKKIKYKNPSKFLDKNDEIKYVKTSYC